MTRRTIALIILNWNGKEDTLACLRSLERIGYPKELIGIYVADNGSTDGSVAAVRAHYDTMGAQGWRELVVVENGRNLGFSAGNNAAWRAVGDDYEYVCLSNNDVVYFEDTFGPLVALFDADAGIGVVGPKVLCHDRPHVLSHGAGYVLRPLMRTYIRDSLAPVACEYVQGCALVIRQDVARQLDTLLDEEFFMYCEDTDLCARVRALGYTVYYCPDSQIMHKVGGGGAGRPTPAQTYCKIHSKFIYVRKHFTPTARILFYILAGIKIPAFVLRTLGTAPRSGWPRVKAYLRACADGFRGVPGRRYAP